MDDKSEKMLRDMAKAKYGDKKDAISKTIVDSLIDKENKKKNAIEHLNNLLKNPVKAGKGGKLPKTRAEIYKR